MAAPPRKHAFAVTADEAGLRLDQVLPRHVAELSRGKARLVIELGGVFVDKKRVKVASRSLRPGQRVEVHLGGVFERAQPGKASSPYVEGAQRALEGIVIVHQDAHLVVLEKPAGVLSAPTPESDQGTAVTWLAAKLGGAVHVVHRLDRPTSGLIVYARTAEAAAGLSESLRGHELDRGYELCVVGHVPFESREVTTPVRGKSARTVFSLVGHAGERASRLRAKLFTGRTHQIRAHALAVGHPVCGDTLYSLPEQRAPLVRAPRLCLHASSLTFVHPVTREHLSFESRWPEDLEEFWSSAGA